MKVWLITIVCLLTLLKERAGWAQPFDIRFEEVSSGSRPPSIEGYLCQMSGAIVSPRDRICRQYGHRSVNALLRRVREAEARVDRPLLQSLLVLLCMNVGNRSAFSFVYKDRGRMHTRSLPRCLGSHETQLALSGADAEAEIRRLLPRGIPPARIYLNVAEHRTIWLPRFVPMTPRVTPPLTPPNEVTVARLPRPAVRTTVVPASARTPLPSTIDHAIEFLDGMLGHREPSTWFTPLLTLLLGLLCWKSGNARGFAAGEVTGRIRGRELALRRIEPGLEQNGLSLEQVITLPPAVYRTSPEPASNPNASPSNVLDTRASDPDKTPFASTLGPYHAPTPALGVPLGTAAAGAAKKSGVFAVQDDLELRRSLIPRPMRDALDGLDALAREVARLWHANLPNEDTRKTLLADPTASAADILRLLIDLATEHHLPTPSFFASASVATSTLPTAKAPAAPKSTYSLRSMQDDVVIVSPPSTEALPRPCKQWSNNFGPRAPVPVRAILKTMAAAAPARQDALVWMLAATLLRHVVKDTPTEKTA